MRLYQIYSKINKSVKGRQKTTLFYRGSDQGGGVGGVNYTEYSNGNELNYKIYNLRGDVIKTVGVDKNTKSFSHYYAFGNHDDVYGSIPNDDFRANTKVEDDDNLLNDGKRFRHLELDVFLTPDPLEYVDGSNPYIYCNQNPWGKWDPEGLEEDPGTKIFKGIQDRVSALKKVDSAAGRKAQHTFNENRRAFQQLPKEYAKASLEVGITMATSIAVSKAALPYAKALETEAVAAKKILAENFNAASKIVYDSLKVAPSVAKETITNVATTISNPTSEAILRTTAISIVSGVVLESTGADTSAVNSVPLPPLLEVANAGATVGGAIVKAGNELLGGSNNKKKESQNISDTKPAQENQKSEKTTPSKNSQSKTNEKSKEGET